MPLYGSVLFGLLLTYMVVLILKTEHQFN